MVELVISVVLGLVLAAELGEGVVDRRRLRALRLHGPVDHRTGLARGAALQQRFQVELRRMRRLGGHVELAVVELAADVDADAFGRALREQATMPLAATRVDDRRFAVVRPVIAGRSAPAPAELAVVRLSHANVRTVRVDETDTRSAEDVLAGAGIVQGRDT